MAVNACLVQSLLWNLRLDNSAVKQMQGIVFEINGRVETSRHFLSFHPVLKEVHQKHIGQIVTSDNFIRTVFDFYAISDHRIGEYQEVADVCYRESGFAVELISDSHAVESCSSTSVIRRAPRLRAKRL